MITAIISILIITSIVWLVKNKLKFEICPICIGVTLTWLWILIAMNLGKLSIIDYQLPTAFLMGGTVVGLMSKLEQFIKIKFILFWKTLFVALGFMAAYNLLFGSWMIFVIGIVLAVTITLVLKTHITLEENQKTKQAKELEEKMKKCC